MSSEGRPKRSAVPAAGYPVRQLAESIILQALEDLWSPLMSTESIRFFNGRGFELCSAMADMTAEERLKLLTMVAATRASCASATRATL